MTPRMSSWWLYGFVVLQLVLQAALMIPGIGDARTALRAVAFGSSIVLLALPGRGSHPLAPLVMFILGILTLGLFHPSLNSPLAGIATVGFYLAIWGPVFWVGRVAVTPLVLANLILILWVFHSLSAGLGVLQVYDPGRFAPDPVFVKELLGASAAGLMVEVGSGQMIYRPFGLTDTPGGAAVSGSFVVLVGLFMVRSRGWVWPVLGVASVSLGLFCIYLSYIRSVLIVTAVSVFGLIAGLIARGQVGRAVTLAAVAAVVSSAVFVWAASVGKGVSDRFATLLEDNPADVYQTNRGVFLTDTLEVQLPKYPVGAGLGRYGMMNRYFGTDTNPDSPPLWSEIQPTAWVFDGGVLLLIAGYAAIVMASGMAARLALRVRDDSLAGLAAVVAAFDLSILVNTVGYSNFLSQGGMMFWVLNAALYAACQGAARRS